MKQTKNAVKIVGKVDSYDLRTGVTKAGVPYISGRANIDCGNGDKVPVEFFSTEQKKDGTPNTICAGLKSFLEQAKTIADHGEDIATIVDINRAELSENYWSPDGATLIDGFRISTSFLNRAKTEVKPENFGAKFQIEAYFLDITDEIKNDIPTGNALINVCTVGYNGSIDKIVITADNPAAVAFAKGNLNKGDLVEFAGDVVYVQKTEIVPKETSFGEPIEEAKSITKKELILKSIGQITPDALDAEAFAEAKKARDAARAEALARAKQKATAATAPKAGSAADFSI